MAAKVKETKSSKGKTKADKPRQSKKARLSKSKSPSSAGDSASAYEQGSDEESVKVLSAEESEEEQEAVSESDLSDEEEQPSKKRRKSGGSTPKSKGKGKSKDDLNTRVVKKVKQIPGPKEDPSTSVILPTTLQFLKELVDHNDRDWFQENDARYRHALANFSAFITAWVPLASEADWSLPHLPAKELMQRIYRDVRFSKDKTPYKTNMSASHSRTGRKGPFAFYHIQIAPQSDKHSKGNSMLGAGYWGPSSENTKKIREALVADSAPFRKLLKDKTFVKYFGEPDPKKGRTSVFGADDALKKAPKMEGVTKDHPEIDLLKLRSIGVVHYFKDSEVLDEDFLKKHLIPCMEAAAPFVQYLNELTHPSPPSDDEEEEEEKEAAAEESEGGSAQAASASGDAEEDEDEE